MHSEAVVVKTLGASHVRVCAPRLAARSNL